MDERPSQVSRIPPPPEGLPSLLSLWKKVSSPFGEIQRRARTERADFCGSLSYCAIFERPAVTSTLSICISWPARLLGRNKHSDTNVCEPSLIQRQVEVPLKTWLVRRAPAALPSVGSVAEKQGSGRRAAQSTQAPNRTLPTPHEKEAPSIRPGGLTWFRAIWHKVQLVFGKVLVEAGSFWESRLCGTGMAWRGASRVGDPRPPTVPHSPC